MIVFHEGPSLIDRKTPIVVLGVEDQNPKTGRMLFTWILRQDQLPEKAAYNGDDEAICGNCIFRSVPGQGRESRRCYVRLGDTADEALSPNRVWQNYVTGGFKHSRDGIYKGKLPVRIGSYGDPSAVPTRVWEKLVSYAPHFTGYTAMWRTCDPDLKRFCMASCQSPEDRIEAISKGWRAFTVCPENFNPPKTFSDILCPATQGKTTCSKCQLCMGTTTRATKSIYELIHGPGKGKHSWAV